MKMDKIKFAQLIGFISCQYRLTITQDDMREIDDMIDVTITDPNPVFAKASCDDVDELLKQVMRPEGLIHAIKAYRVLTGAGLKESKDAIERYWSNADKKYSIADLRSKLNSEIWNAADYSAIEEFLKRF